MPSPPPPCARRCGPRCHNGADSFPERRGHSPGAADGRTIYYYIRVRRREGENVLHRAASNDVDNFSVDNPLWITAAAGGRLLRGGRGRLCGGSVNAGTKMQTRTGRVRKASRGKCERGRGSANADGAGAEVFAGDGCSQGRLSAPWLQFHGADRADVYIIIHVRACCCCGECALNPPTSQPTPRRRPPLAPAQRHALAEHFRSLPEHFRSPAPRRCIPRRPHNPFPAEALRSPPHSDTPSPSTSASHAAPTHARRLRDAFPADLTTHSRRRPSPTPAQQHALPEHFRSPTQPRRTPAGCAMHARRPHNPFPAQRHAASPSVPLRAQKNGTAQCMCDAECLGRPSLRSVIGVGEPRAVRRRCGALAWRVGLRPQPWALRSRRCGRVLRA